MRDWAELTPERIALSYYGRDLTYGELNASVDAAARTLAELGVRKGDRVALHMDNCPQFVIAYFGILRAGAVVVPVNPMFKQVELEHQLMDAGATTLIGLDYLYPEVEKVRARTELKNVILSSLGAYLPEKPTLPVPAGMETGGRSFPDTISFETLVRQSSDSPQSLVDDLKKDLAVLQYTGGTTGIPKGAMISPEFVGSFDVALVPSSGKRCIPGGHSLFPRDGPGESYVHPAGRGRSGNHPFPFFTRRSCAGDYPLSMHLLGGAHHRDHCFAQPAQSSGL
jgi:acyl-CoA synthetase (AMP-forming)/AMP-acid ligase II